MNDDNIKLGFSHAINGDVTFANLFYVKFEDNFINPNWVVSTTLPKSSDNHRTIDMTFYNIKGHDTKETVFEKFVNWKKQKEYKNAEIVLLDGNGNNYTTFELHGLRPYDVYIKVNNGLDYISTELLKVKVSFCYAYYIVKF